MNWTKTIGESLSSDRKPFKALIALIVIATIPFGILCFTGLKLNTNILDLLPETGHNAQTEKAVKHFTENISSNSLFLIKSNKLDESLKAAKHFEEELKQSGLFSEVYGKKSNSEFKLWYELYFPHRYHLLTDEHRQILKNGEVDKFLQSRIKLLYSPQSSLYSANLEKDPLMLFGNFIQSLPSPGSFSIKNGYLYKEKGGKHLIMLSAKFKGSVFSSSIQKQFRALLDRFSSQRSQVELMQLGFFPYAERARSQAEWEISYIGTGSIIGIILLFIFVFRSLNPLLFTLLSISAGVIWALLITQTLFAKIHIITIVFGATLTGVCVDYAFHWFCHFRYSRDSKNHHLKKGIIWGAATSLIAYAGLFFADFPGLKQIAIFSTSGIIVSVLTVLFLFPRSKPINSNPPKLIEKLKNRFGSTESYILLAIVLLISLGGWFSLSTNDDIRLLQDRPADLVAQEEEFRSLLAPYDNSRFILVSAENNEELIIKERSIVKDLQAEKDILEDTLSISSMLPSVKEQQSDFELLSKLINSSKFSTYCQELGFDNKVIVNAKANLINSKPLSLKNFLKHPAAAQVKQLYIEKAEQASSIILLKGISNSKEISMTSATSKAQYIDKVKDTSLIMGKFKFDAFLLTIIAYALIFLLLIYKFKFNKAVKIISPPVLAVFISCGLLSLFGLSFNLFNILSLILILGIGIDYSIFYAFSEGDSATNSAVTLSTISTLLAFGLLAFSSTAALSSFGLTLALGILVSYFLAPLSKN